MVGGFVKRGYALARHQRCARVQAAGRCCLHRQTPSLLGGSLGRLRVIDGGCWLHAARAVRLCRRWFAAWCVRAEPVVLARSRELYHGREFV